MRVPSRGHWALSTRPGDAAPGSAHPRPGGPAAGCRPVVTCHGWGEGHGWQGQGSAGRRRCQGPKSPRGASQPEGPAEAPRQRQLHGTPEQSQPGGISPGAGAAGCQPRAVRAHASPGPVLTVLRPAAGTGLAAGTPACTAMCPCERTHMHAWACARVQTHAHACRAPGRPPAALVPRRFPNSWLGGRPLCSRNGLGKRAPSPASPTAPDLCTNSPGGGCGEGIKWEIRASPM